MTFITDGANRYFARRGAPGRTRVWLRRKSAVFGHFDPPPTVFRVCGGCGDMTEAGTDVTAGGRTVLRHAGIVDGKAKHRIGTAFIEGKRYAKFCDGAETPEV